MSVVFVLLGAGSLSARRAWIEIIDDLEPSRTRKVALSKESVDRNAPCLTDMSAAWKSLSARRAWIEINMWCSVAKFLACRSPQGERG